MPRDVQNVQSQLTEASHGLGGVDYSISLSLFEEAELQSGGVFCLDGVFLGNTHEEVDGFCDPQRMSPNYHSARTKGGDGGLIGVVSNDTAALVSSALCCRNS